MLEAKQVAGNLFTLLGDQQACMWIGKQGRKRPPEGGRVHHERCRKFGCERKHRPGIQRRIDRLGNLKGNRHTTAWQRQNEHI